MPNFDSRQTGFFQAGEVDAVKDEKFGTFTGVFRPTILTIIGVMLYLREGWLVANAGLGGAILIILSCYLITGTTALAISSITTNIRVGSGGVFSIISQSLGLEMGGAIGIPFYLAQGLSAAMYIHGFAEGWIFLFPSHEPYLIYILIGAFSVALGLAYFSTKLAFQVQLIVMVAIICALTSMAFGLKSAEVIHTPQLWGSFEKVSYWELFAVFFPASTGILVGASMSGNLREPRRSIPKGTLAAWGVSLIIYLAGAFYYALIADSDSLQNPTAGIQHAYWPRVVLVGLMASCFTAALSSMTAAPRILQALASHKIIPYSNQICQIENGEPRKAILYNSLLVLITVVLGSLNNIAEILTIFFILTYFIINLVLLIEKQLNMLSFRPLFNVPIIVPLLGSFTCLSAIMIISPVAGIISVFLTIIIYIMLDYRKLETPWETVHSGLMGSIANWAAKKVFVQGRISDKRSWKPDFLIPTQNTHELEGVFRIIKSLAYPQGSAQIIAIEQEEKNKTCNSVNDIIKDLQTEKLFATSSTITNNDYAQALKATVSIMKGSFFRPNTLFDTINDRRQEDLQSTLDIAKDNKMGVVFIAKHPTAGFGRERTVNLWVRDQAPDWKLGLELANLNYAVLMSYKLQQNWNASVRMICAVRDSRHTDDAHDYITNLLDLARLNSHYTSIVENGSLEEVILKSPRADINIFGLSQTIDKEMMMNLVQKTGSSCLFVMDSGQESALI